VIGEPSCEVCTVEWANLDIRSLSLNCELKGVIYDGQLARELKAAFVSDVRGCSLFDAAEYKLCAVLSRLPELGARLVSPLMSERGRAPFWCDLDDAVVGALAWDEQPSSSARPRDLVREWRSPLPPHPSSRQR
jgi:phosphatidylserine/phosphatidylglycerophosphate/cardiolipin synthase-like enzyme